MYFRSLKDTAICLGDYLPFLDVFRGEKQSVPVILSLHCPRDPLDSQHIAKIPYLGSFYSEFSPDYA